MVNEIELKKIERFLDEHIGVEPGTDPLLLEAWMVCKNAGNQHKRG